MADQNPTPHDYWRKKAEMLRGEARGKSPTEAVTLMAGTLNEIADALEALDRHDTPAWQANERLNERAEICFQALESILVDLPPAKYERIARDALEAASNVR